MNDEQQPDLKVTRVIDFRIPLPWLISGVISVAFTLVSMWFSLDRLIKDVADLQITVKAGNSQATTVAGEIALLRYRVENLEADKRLPTPAPIPPRAVR